MLVGCQRAQRVSAERRGCAALHAHALTPTAGAILSARSTSRWSRGAMGGKSHLATPAACGRVRPARQDRAQRTVGVARQGRGMTGCLASKAGGCAQGRCTHQLAEVGQHRSIRRTTRVLGTRRRLRRRPIRTIIRHFALGAELGCRCRRSLPFCIAWMDRVAANN